MFFSMKYQLVVSEYQYNLVRELLNSTRGEWPPEEQEIARVSTQYACPVAELQILVKYVGKSICDDLYGHPKYKRVPRWYIEDVDYNILCQRASWVHMISGQ